MLLNEIFNSDKSDQRWTDQLQALIDKHGLKKFSGNQATVITSDDSTSVYRIWARDPGYEKWLAVAEKMQSNPHVMKIKGRMRTVPTQFKGMPKDVKLRFVKLEKLAPIRDDEINELVIAADHILSGWSISERNEHDVDSFIATIMAELERDENLPHMKELAEKHRSFLETVLEVSRNGFNDFHEENVMLRGDTLVITDPAG